MSIRTTRKDAERRTVPSLQIMSRLEPAGDGDGASLRMLPGGGLLAALVAVVAAVAVAAAAFALTHGSGHQPGRGAAARGHLGGLSPRFASRDGVLSATGSRLALRGLRAASRSVASAAAAGATAADQSTAAAAQAAPAPHYLSSADLTDLADHTSGYQPASYLVRDYQSVADRYQIPWRVLAAVEYIKGDYVNATAGDSARPERALGDEVQASGHLAVNAHLLARATAAAAQPSAGLALDAKRLAADGAAQGHPAQAVSTFMSDSGVAAQSVLTLAQAIDTSVSSATAPTVKVAAMLDEARLLNGLPYIWGGGHTEPAWVVSAGYDCSGFVSEVLHSAGYLTSPDTTQTLPGSAGIARGPGKYVTIYDRTIATLKVWVKKKKMVTKKEMVNPATAGVHVTRGRRANSLTAVQITVPRWVGEWKTIHITKLVRSQDTSNNDEHVIIDIDGQWWESGGSSSDGGAAMVHPIINPSTAYLKSFNKILHPQGL
jgi:cell wall-associated NlpC family hydrolase